MRARTSGHRHAKTWLPGRDKQAVRHPARTGKLTPASGHAAPSVAVIGGGIAGITAAVGLAERGIRVTMLEREPQLGGRVRAWPVTHQGVETTMSRGFHAFFRQYYNLRTLIRRVDPALEGLTPIGDYPLVLAGGHRDSFAKIPKTPPLNMAAFVARSPSFSLSDLGAVDIPAALELLDVDFPATFSAYDGQSAADFLDRLHFPSGARHLALEVFARSFFAPPTEFSAGELVAMFHTYFLGSSEGLLFDVPVDDYDTVLWAPLGRYLHKLGADLRTGAEVQHVDLAGPGVAVRLTSGETFHADAVVLATDLGATRRLLGGASGLTGLANWADSSLDSQDWQTRLAETRDAPRFAVWRIWLDRLVSVDRPPFLGTSGFGPLDNVTVLERFEAGARRWSDAHGGSVVEVHAYALPPSADDQVVREQLRSELGKVYPETSAAQVVAEEWLVQQDCPLIGTGPWARRLEVTTPDPRVVLAGDGIRCDFPVALMERAATTGWLAANQLLVGWGLAGHELWTVPMQSRHRLPGLVRQAATGRAGR